MPAHESMASPDLGAARRFQPAPGVMEARADGAMVLMHRGHGTYHTLNETGACVWELLMQGRAIGEAAAAIADAYEVDEARVEADVASVVDALVAGGLLEPAGSAARCRSRPAPERRLDRLPAEAEVKVPSALRCALSISLVKASLRLLGFDRTIAKLRRRCEAIALRSGDDTVAVTYAERSVALAAALYPGRARCLEQSLALYSLLRRQGIAVRYRQGIQPRPFAAHAWVEYRGTPVNDVAEHVALYTPLPDLLP